MFTHKVYISYPEENVNYAAWLSKVFEINGIEAILPDYTDYDITKMPSLIEKADKVLILCSKKMKDTDIQSKETEEAFKQKRDKIISVSVEKCLIDGQYNYYFTFAKRFEIYREKAKTLKSIIGYIKSDGDNALFTKGMLKYDISLLSEEDIDRLLNEPKSKKTLMDLILPYARVYSNNETVSFAMKCYGTIYLFIYALMALLLITKSFEDVSFFSVIMNAFWLTLVFLLVWNLSYFASVLIAKLKVKSKAGIIGMVFFSFWIFYAIIEFAWRFIW